MALLTTNLPTLAGPYAHTFPGVGIIASPTASPISP
jgi:hypothetical protein